jgi:hypothetical protein
MVNKEKLNFIKNDFIQLVSQLNGNETPQWGKMNAQQMVEHMGDAFLDATGMNKRTLLTPDEQLAAFRSFMMSDKDFKPNTKNALMSETPDPVKFENYEAALQRLKQCICDFENHFSENEMKKEMNPFFGELNFEEAVQLLHKHVRHHLRQFKLID